MNKTCARCEKTVYPTEELKCLDKVWHKGCFKCQECGMTLNMRTYKGYGKLPYCEAHVPKAKPTTMAETPELKRIAENTKIQSNVKYHADFEKSKGKFTQVADDPETLRIKANTKIISNVAYHGDLEKKAQMEKQRQLNENGELVDATNDNYHQQLENYATEMLPPPNLPPKNHYQTPTTQYQQQPVHQHQQSAHQQQQSVLQQQQNLHQHQQNVHQQQQHTVHQQSVNQQLQSMHQQQQNQNIHPQNMHQQQQSLHQQQPSMHQQHQQQQSIHQQQQSIHQQQQSIHQQQQSAHQQQQIHQQQLHQQDIQDMNRQYTQDPYYRQPDSAYNYQKYDDYQSQYQYAQYQQKSYGVGSPQKIGRIQDYDPLSDGPRVPPNTQRTSATLIYNSTNDGKQQRGTRQTQPQQQSRSIGRVTDLDPIATEQRGSSNSQPAANHQVNHQPTNHQSAMNQRVYIAMYDYEANDSDEVSFREGDLISNVTSIDEGWMTGQVIRTGRTGMLPANYVELAPAGAVPGYGNW